MTHDDGSIGVLHVMEEHRKKGIGRMLVDAITDEMHRCGQVPYMHIEPENEASLALAKACGYTADRMIWWIGI